MRKQIDVYWTGTHWTFTGASEPFPTRALVTVAARVAAKLQGAELVFHNKRTGRIGESNSYGNESKVKDKR